MRGGGMLLRIKILINQEHCSSYNDCSHWCYKLVENSLSDKSCWVERERVR